MRFANGWEFSLQKLQPKAPPVSLGCSCLRHVSLSGKPGADSAILSSSITLNLTGPKGHFREMSPPPFPQSPSLTFPLCKLLRPDHALRKTLGLCNIAGE